MILLEWSDTQLKFKITETEDWTTTDVDLSDYDKIILTMKYKDGIVDYEWEIVEETVGQTTKKYVVFEFLSESTAWRRWAISCDIWWVNWDWKIRFNDETIKWQILPSIKIPEWTASE